MSDWPDGQFDGRDDKSDLELPMSPTQTDVLARLEALDRDTRWKPSCRGAYYDAALRAIPALLRVVRAAQQARGVLSECNSDYNSPYFADRHGTGPRVAAALNSLHDTLDALERPDA